MAIKRPVYIFRCIPASLYESKSVSWSVCLSIFREIQWKLTFTNQSKLEETNHIMSWILQSCNHSINREDASLTLWALFRCVIASLWEGLSVRPPVSVRPSVDFCKNREKSIFFHKWKLKKAIERPEHIISQDAFLHLYRRVGSLVGLTFIDLF